jgi:hypothetical protein
MLDQKYATSAATRSQSAKKPGGASADDDDIVVHRGSVVGALENAKPRCWIRFHKPLLESRGLISKVQAD